MNWLRPKPDNYLPILVSVPSNRRLILPLWRQNRITPSTTLIDNGEFKLGDQVRKNAKDAAYGALQLPRALTVSSDVFFYQLGEPGLAIRYLARWFNNYAVTGSHGIRR